MFFCLTQTVDTYSRVSTINGMSDALLSAISAGVPSYGHYPAGLSLRGIMFKFRP